MRRTSSQFGLCILLGSLALVSGGCLSLDRDVHLAPFYTHVSRGGGGTEVEALGGIVRVRPQARPGGPSEWAVRPVVRSVDHGDGTSTTRFLVPLGKHAVREDATQTQMLPLFLFRNFPEGAPKDWFLFTLPGVFWEKNDTGRTLKAVFPFGGVMEDFLSYDRIEFALFPLFMRTRRAEKKTLHFLFPVFAHSGGPGYSVLRFWPFYGHTVQEGRHDRRFALWPFIHWHDNFQYLGDERQTKWLVWPFFGVTRKGSYRSFTFLWPFFGYARNPETGFSAWDGPWPLVRFQAPGKNEGAARRFRIWPFYGSMILPDVEAHSALWPIISWRREKYRNGERTAQYVVPLWQNWNATGGEGDGDAWQKLWPVHQYRKENGVERFATPALNPLWHTPIIDEHYAWLYELYTREEAGSVVHGRSWAGLWRREKDAEEDRRSFSGIWAHRSYRSGGEEVRETSILFGLLRWRKPVGKPLQWLRPSFPGPGWPTRTADAAPTAP